jgi:hypothetical protein
MEPGPSSSYLDKFSRESTTKTVSDMKAFVVVKEGNRASSCFGTWFESGGA